MKKLTTLLALIFSVLFVFRCANQPGPTAGGGSDTETAFSGRILYTSGAPAQGVTVRVYPVNYVPSLTKTKASGSVVLTTDSNGYYNFGQLDSGLYNIDASIETLGVFLDSIEVIPALSKNKAPDGILRKLGMIHGISFMPGQNDTNQVRITLYMPGTGRITKPIIGGYFSFANIPAGSYQLIMDPTLSDYYVKILNVSVGNGEIVDLDTIFINGKDYSGMPQISAGSSITVSINDTVHLRGSATDPFGSIEKYEWDIGNTGTFVQTASGDTAFLAASMPDSGFECVFRVTDNSANIALDTVLVTVVQDIPIAYAGRDTFTAINTPVTLTGTGAQQFGRIVQYAWDLDGNGTWDDSSATRDTATVTYANVGINRIFFRVRDDDWNSNVDTLVITVATLLGGGLNSDDTMRLANSPYVLTSDLNVYPSATLYIEPGVTINFERGSIITVSGAIRAIGTETDSIYFKSGTGTQLEFRNTSLSGNKFQYIRFEENEQSMLISTGTSGELQISNSLISGGITVDGSSNYVHVVKISKSSLLSTSMTFGGIAGSIQFDSCKITGTSLISGSASYTGATTGILVSNSELANCIIVSRSASTFPNVTMRNSSLFHCMIGGDAFSGFADITECILDNTAILIDYLTLNNDSLKYDDSYNSNAGVVFASGTISNSTFQGTADIVGIHRDYLYYGGTASAAKIDSSSISGFKIGVKQTGSSALGSAFTISNCNFLNNVSYDVSNESIYTIGATNNYWGTADTSTIPAHILDYYDNMDYGRVNYAPASVLPK